MLCVSFTSFRTTFDCFMHRVPLAQNNHVPCVAVEVGISSLLQHLAMPLVKTCLYSERCSLHAVLFMPIVLPKLPGGSAFLRGCCNRWRRRHCRPALPSSSLGEPRSCQGRTSKRFLPSLSYWHCRAEPRRFGRAHVS